MPIAGAFLHFLVGCIVVGIGNGKYVLIKKYGEFKDLFGRACQWGSSTIFW
jgi:hypothetical protein